MIIFILNFLNFEFWYSGQHVFEGYAQRPLRYRSKKVSLSGSPRRNRTRKDKKRRKKSPQSVRAEIQTLEGIGGDRITISHRNKLANIFYTITVMFQTYINFESNFWKLARHCRIILLPYSTQHSWYSASEKHPKNKRNKGKKESK